MEEGRWPEDFGKDQDSKNEDGEEYQVVENYIHPCNKSRVTDLSFSIETEPGEEILQRLV